MGLHMTQNTVRKNGFRSVDWQTASLRFHDEMGALPFVKIVQGREEGSRD